MSRTTHHSEKMGHDPKGRCYLCGDLFGRTEVNDDHVFQQQFITRGQPKAKGFDYAGILPVHAACNKMFGTGNQAPEAICSKALRLLEALNEEDALKVRQDNSNHRIAAINSTRFPDFTPRDLTHFKLIDVTNVPFEDWAHGNYLLDKQPINPFQIATNVALSTLAKSTAGFLVKRHDVVRSSHWRILALPFYTHGDDLDCDSLFGSVKPLEVGIKLWLKSEGSVWSAGYKHNRFFVVFYIEFVASDNFRQVRAQLNAFWKDSRCLFFASDKLTDLIGYDWTSNQYPL